MLRFNSSIQFNSKTLFKDGDPVSFKTYLPWGHPNMKTNTTIIHTYIQNKTGSSENHRQTQLTLSYKTSTLILNLYNVYTIHETLINV